MDINVASVILQKKLSITIFMREHSQPFLSKEAIIAISIFIVNFVLKLCFVNYPDVSLDEPFTIFHSQKSLSELFAIFSKENNPPLFFLITHFAIKIGGVAPIAVRFIPVLISSLLVVEVFRFTLKNWGMKVAFLTATLMTFSNYHFYVAHEARAYGLLALLTIYSFLLLIKLQQKEKVFLNSSLLVVVNALLLYTHFLGFFIPFTQLVIILVLKEYRVLFKRFFLIGISTLLLYGPYLYIFLIRLNDTVGGGSYWIEKPTLMSFYFTLWEFLNMPLPTLIAIGAMLVVAVLVIVQKKTIPTMNKLVLLWFLFPFLFMYAISFKIPMFIPKYLIHVSIPFYILIAISAFQLPLKIMQYVVALVLAFSVGFTFQPKKNKREVSLIADFLKENKTQDTKVMIAPHYADIQIAYYYNREIFTDYRHIEQRMIDEHFICKDKMAEVDTNDVLKAKKVIFIGAGAHVADPENSIKVFLENHFDQVENHELCHGFEVKVFRFGE